MEIEIKVTKILDLKEVVIARRTAKTFEEAKAEIIKIEEQYNNVYGAN